MLHGGDATSFSGLSVATITTMIAHFFGAGSITLLGQDLVLGIKPMPIMPAKHSFQKSKQTLAIRGNWRWFSCYATRLHVFYEEFGLIAAHLKDEVTLVNSTSGGAYISGWDHISLSQHPYRTLSPRPGPIEAARGWKIRRL